MLFDLADRLFVGDFLETLPRAAMQLGAHSALAHLDVGSGNVAASQALASAMMPLVLRLLKPGAVVVSDQPITDPALEGMPLPAGIEPERYFLNRRL